MEADSNQNVISYLKWLGATALIWAAFLIALAISVDPYQIWGTPVLTGWTELKPRIYQQAAIAKTNQLERIVPKTLLLGNSRAEIGFNPVSKVWPAEYQPVFNAAEAGTGLPTALAMLREAIAIRPPRTVLLELDFQDFLSRQDPDSVPLPPIGPDERRLLITREGNKNPERTLQIWRDRFITTLTFDALSDTILTILDQDRRTTVTMTKRGFNPLHEYTLYGRRTGYYELFRAKALDYDRQYSAYKVPDFSAPDKLANFANLATIVALAHQHGIKLIFFTEPYHADYLEMLHVKGLWPSFEEWKRSLAQFAWTENVPLFDFAEYDSFTTERVPSPGDRNSEMHFYWEPGHHKETLGEEMLKVMINGATSSFGRLLTPANVEAAIREIRYQRKAYIRKKERGMENPEAVPSLLPRLNDE